jgi:outer membrane protein TolC
MSTGRIALAACLLLVCTAAVPGAARAQQVEPQVAGTAAAPVPAGVTTPAMGAGQNPFLGGRPTGKATSTVLPLSLADVLARGLEQNLGVFLGQQNVQAAVGARQTALANLLPNVNGRVAPAREVINLEAFGFPLPPGSNPLIGPFNVIDYRIAASQTVFDWSAVKSAHAGSEAVTAAKLSYKDARDTVVFVVANLYLQVLVAAGEIQASQAQVATSQALYNRAVDMKTSGVVPAIEVLRAQVQLQAQQQRLIFYQNEFEKRKLSLARAIGLPLDQPFELTDKAPYAELEPMSLDAALNEAYRSRPDLQSAAALVRAAEDRKSAAHGLYLPSVGVTADVGKIGPSTSTALTTWTVAAGVRVPIFTAGATGGRVAQATAALEQQRAEFEDLRVRVEYDVRSAFLDLKAADDRVKVARGSVDLANQQLTQAQDRFGAGVASNIEVVQAQEAVATATDNYISSLYAHNLAKISLARALGVAEAQSGRFLGGAK